MPKIGLSDAVQGTEGRLTRAEAAQYLGSGLVDYSQKMMVAARAMAEKKAVGQRS